MNGGSGIEFDCFFSPPAVFHSIQKCFDGMKTKEGRRTANKTNQLTNEIKLFNFMELMVCLVGAPQQLLSLLQPKTTFCLCGREKKESWLLRLPCFFFHSMKDFQLNERLPPRGRKEINHTALQSFIEENDGRLIDFSSFSCLLSRSANLIIKERQTNLSLFDWLRHQSNEERRD